VFKVSVVTVFPTLYDGFFSHGLVKKGIEKGIISINSVSLIEAAKKKRIDVPIVGHGSGMVLNCSVVEEAYDSIKKEPGTPPPYKIFFSPAGKKLTQPLLKEIYQHVQQKNNHLVLFAGRYEGFDIRSEEEYADIILSVGDFVCNDGDIPAQLFMSAFFRLIPGFVGKEESVINDSFTGSLVDTSHYGKKPSIWKERGVPELLKSGNHQEVDEWRYQNSLQRTANSHFAWWRLNVSSQKEKQDIKKYIPRHYVLLLHNDVMLPGNIVGESSVTSIDIHDISRSAATYGLSGVFIVTRLVEQQKLVEKFLSFWQKGAGRECNESRAFALRYTKCMGEINEVKEHLKVVEGVEPIMIATSSRREIPHGKMITYNDQEIIWKLQRPVLFILGTAHGIDPQVMNICDFRLLPIEGFEEFNFLSVRSAAAVIFDRWLGIQSKKLT